MVYALLVIASLMVGMGMAPGQAGAQAAHASKSPVNVAGHADANVPDAMTHMIKAPTVDIASLRDPFASYLALIAKRGQQALAERQARLASRTREPLEDFDLATLHLVATMQMGKDRVAMIEDNTGKGYIVRRGNHMGKYNGRIERIADDSLNLVEQVANPAGDIVNRKVSLTLKEVNQ